MLTAIKATTLHGPFVQILPMSGLPDAGPIHDDALHIISNGGVVVADGKITAVGDFTTLSKEATKNQWAVHEVQQPAVLLPGFIDAHTHICFAGSRARDYALRVAGQTYTEILKHGGGIHDTVAHTRAATVRELEVLLRARCERLYAEGVTTCEVKSGYGLSVAEELKVLHAINNARVGNAVDLIPTCLAAHVVPKEFKNTYQKIISDENAYLQTLITELLPVVQQQGLSRRVDIYIDDGAFTEKAALVYLTEAKKLGFDIVVHADQFITGGSRVAASTSALSADHLEASSPDDLQRLKKAGVIAVVLPGASLGLGVPFAPARKILDTGLVMAIASDWNPGSAPRGDLLTAAALLGAEQKLTTAEVFAGITLRAARALNLNDRGILAIGQRADMISFATNDYREILYHQGALRPLTLSGR